MAVPLGVVACSERSESFVLVVNNAEVNLADQLPGGWERVCVLHPYSNNRIAEDLLGFAYNLESTSSIYTSDSISLLLTAKGREVVGSYEINRSNVDFAHLGPACYLRDHAVFTVVDKGHPKAHHQ